MHGVIALLGILTALGVLLVAIGVYGVRRLLVLPRPKQRPTPAAFGCPFQHITFRSRDGVALRGWLFPRPGAPTIIYCPGRGTGLNDFDFRYAPLFYNAGYQVLMFDWRGMGASEGSSSMGFSEKLDLAGAVEYLKSRGDSGRIGCIGTSLGAAVVLLAAGDIPDIAAVAGDSAFATYEGMIANGIATLYGLPHPLSAGLAWLLARLAARWRGFPLQAADPVRFVGRISPRPVFIIHGSDDRHVPVAAAHALYAAAGEPKELWIMEGVAHTQGLERLEAEYSRRLVSFFDRWLKRDV